MLGAAHCAHHALRLVEVGIEAAHERAEHLLLRVAEVAPRAIVVVDDGALAGGGDDDVARTVNQPLQSFPG